MALDASNLETIFTDLGNTATEAYSGFSPSQAPVIRLTVIPEPSIVALLVGATAFSMAFRRRRTHKE